MAPVVMVPPADTSMEASTPYAVVVVPFLVSAFPTTPRNWLIVFVLPVVCLALISAPVIDSPVALAAPATAAEVRKRHT